MSVVKGKAKLVVLSKRTRTSTKTPFTAFEINGRRAYIIYDYSPLKAVMADKGIKKPVELVRITGISWNVIADIVKARPVKTDYIAIICYSLGVPIEKVLKLRFIEESMIGTVRDLKSSRYGVEVAATNEALRDKTPNIIPKTRNILFDD